MRSSLPALPAALRSSRLRVVVGAGVGMALLSAMAPAPAGAAGAVLPHNLDRRISDTTVTESSGLARSTYGTGTVWTHNDSGGKAHVYAVGADGATQGVVTLRNASFKDWEDIAAGPGNQLWVGDVGDNTKARKSIQAYRFTEPRTLGNQTVTATKFDLTYPDGAHNSEGIMVHPTTGRLYVVTKSPNGGAIYVAPSTLSSTSTNKMTKVVASVPLKITAAAFSPDGTRFVLCNYSTAFLYDGFGASPVSLDKPSLQQGESIEFTATGTSLLMGSEGSRSPIYRTSLVGY